MAEVSRATASSARLRRATSRTSSTARGSCGSRRAKKGKTELYLKSGAALEDYLFDSVCRETVLHRGGDEAPLAGDELVTLVKRTGQARRLLEQLDKRDDGRITAQLAARARYRADGTS